jgi:membrane fusion protein (multidrug efflux system)
MSSQFLRWALLVLAIVLIVAGVTPAIRLYRHFTTHVSTDDAYIDGTVALVSSRVSGTVIDVYVQDNWSVKEGQLLLRLDPRDFEVRVAQAEAQLERARQTVDETYSGIDSATAGVHLAESQLGQAQIDYDRAKTLKEQGVASLSSYDQAQTALKIAIANRSLASHQLEQAHAALGPEVGRDHTRYNRPIVMQAEAALRAAKLDLTYTQIHAPFDGIITHKSVHVGHRIQVGEPLMAIVPARRLYVTANFKETQLTNVRVGQNAEIEADIYPGFIYRGHIDSISMGTGAAFSLLPPENATGNWVKVVQRVPVKIVFDQPVPEDKPLRLGLSVEVSINVSNTRGSLLSSLVQKTFEHGGILTPSETLKQDPIPEIEEPSNTPHGAEPQHPQFLPQSAAPSSQH